MQGWIILSKKGEWSGSQVKGEGVCVRIHVNGCSFLQLFHVKCWRAPFWGCVIVLGCWFGLVANLAWAQPYVVERVVALEREIEDLESRASSTPQGPVVLVQLARLHLQLGGLDQKSHEKQITIFEEGARLAKQALALQEALADAHYYYAANLGSATQLKGVMASALIVEELKLHIRRAVELQDNHAPALHMLGRMLDELPWFLGGNEDEALRALRKAVSVDEYDAHARLDLAKLYRKRGDILAASKELIHLLQYPAVYQSWGWTYQYKTEAERILKELDAPASFGDVR